MNRAFLYLSSAAALPLLADASVKAAALLLLAGVCALLMWRASAAARHMVWLAAVVALLLVPVLAVVLPGWRVLPQWAVVETAAAPAEHRPHRPYEAYTQPPQTTPNSLPAVPAPVSPAPLQPLPPSAVSAPVPPPPPAVPSPAARPLTSRLLPLWLTGCALLLLRLAAAHFLLRRNARRGEPAPGPLAAAFAAAQQESGLRQPVRLLMDNARSIPVVWGLIRPTLLLPAEAVAWDAAQLRSVLLHELAHLRRRDPLVQFLTQIACALHWFNPLVWLAAWRLHVERERACDDMVLASGVRPSTYAEHLLQIATQLSPARWTHACGLAMARKSSLEGRLLAVLSDKLNRRRLTRALTAAAILLSAAIAVPIAMLRAQEEKPAEKSPDADSAKTPERRKLDWSKFPHYNAPEIPFANPFVPADALRLAAAPGKSEKDIRRLIDMIHQAAVEKAVELRPLLNDEQLKTTTDENGSIGFALAAYDYSVNGTKASLQILLDAMASDSDRRSETAAWSLVYVDEWDLTMDAWLKHFVGNAEEHDLFWNVRKFLYPENYAKFVARRLADAKCDAASLRGVWKGSKDGVNAEIRFGDTTEWEITQGDKVSKDVLKTHTDFTGPRIHLSPPPESKGWVRYGFFGPGDAGTLRLHLTPGIELVLTKQADAPGNPEEPQNKAAAKLDPATEAQLDWGDAANGLRGAIVIRPTAPGAEPGVFLAVQNVSDMPLRFSDTIVAEGLRKMVVSDTKGILFGLSSKEPTKTDVVLQPRCVLYLRLLDPVASDEKDVEPTMIEGLRKDSLQTWRAVLNIQSAPDGAWKGKLTTAETRGAISLHGSQPKDKDAQALYKLWQSSARLNGDIPGGLVRLLHDKVKEFIRNNEPDASGAPYAAKMKPLELRFGPAGDWKPADVVALLDDIAAASTIPLETTLDHLTRHTLQPGQALPAAYEKADWGEPLPSGLRMAYLLEPCTEAYHHGTEVKVRYILHNSGKEPVTFLTKGFQQPAHKAALDGGSPLKLDSTYWTTLGRMEAYRLAPGQFTEVYTPGLGIGAQDRNRDDWSNVRAGSWILCEEGDEVIFSPGPLMLAADENASDPNWWLEFISERLAREAPVPADRKEREYLLYRVVRELYGAAPSTTEGDAFAADTTPEALGNLAILLAKHPWSKQAEGPIRAGDTTFKVLPPDPDIAKRVRVASTPGYYSLSDTLKFSVTRRSQGTRIINEASIFLFTGTMALPAGYKNWAEALKDSKNRKLSGNTRVEGDNAITKVELPDGYNTWAAAMEPGTPVLWIKQKDLTRRYDFTDPAQIKETRHEGEVPARVLEAMKPILNTSEEAPAPKDNPPPAATPDEKKTAVKSPTIDELARRVTAATEKSRDDVARLREMILRASADKRPELQHLLKDEQLKQADDELQSIRLALAAYDYSLNGNKEALQFILNKVATVTEDDSDEVALDTLAWIDEWELSTAAHGKHASRIYGAQVDGPGAFWEQREDLFPEKYAKHFAKAQQTAKMDAASLRGVWKGSKDGLSVELRLDDKNEWDVRQGDKTISKAVIGTHTPPGGSMVELSIQEASKEMAGYAYSWLKRGSDGSLYLHLYREAAQQRPSVVEVELTRQADAPDPPAATPDEKKTSDAAPKPQHEYAQSLFASWLANARSDGKIPGALVGLLAGKVDEFIKGYTGAGQDAVNLKALRPKLDATRDWTPAEAVALLDEIAAINHAPLGWAEMPMKFDGFRHIKAGEALPIELKSAAWGAPAENGLRAAWLLEPRAEQYAHGTVLKARVLFHNAGKEAVIFQTETWHQYDGHKAIDAKGADISVKGTRYTGITPMATFRLAPGEYCEVTGHGLAIGAGQYKEEFNTGSVGAIIEAKEGDFVTLSHTVDVSYGGWTRPGDPKGPAELRKKQIAERVAREAPLPAAAADRELLIRRVALDLTGVAPTPEEIAAFTADQSPDALANLTTRLQSQPAVKLWAGKLPTGETKFRVLPADPDAAKKPRTANAPGRYVLGDNAQLQITQVTEGDTRTNSAEIIFLAPDPKQESPHKPHKFDLPDGMNNYAIVWERGSGSLMVVERGSVRTVNFTNPAKVTEDRAKVNLAPKFRAVLPPGLLNFSQPATEKPKGASTAPPTEPRRRKVDWSKPPQLSFFEGTYDPALITRLVEQPQPISESNEEGAEAWELASQLLRAAVEKDPQFRHLLSNEKLNSRDTSSRILTMALAAYDYSVFGNKAGLKLILDQLVSDEPEAYIAAFPLGFIDEWDETIPAMEKGFAKSDGAKGEEHTRFWIHREWLFPESFAAFQKRKATEKPKTGAAKLTPESLIGAWRGTVNGEKLMLSFHRPPAEKDVQCDIYFGEATIGALAGFTIAEDGGSAEVVQQSVGGGMKFGTLIPDVADKLKLELYGRQQGQQEMMLTRDAEPPVSNERKSSTQPKSGAKLDRAKLEGTWAGEKDGATVKVEFQWLSEHQQVRWEVKRPGSSIAAEMSAVMAPDGNSADFIFRKGLDFEATQGRVTPGEGVTLHLEIIPNPNVSDPGYPAVKGLVLKRNPDGTVPKTSEAGAVR